MYATISRLQCALRYHGTMYAPITRYDVRSDMAVWCALRYHGTMYGLIMRYDVHYYIAVRCALRYRGMMSQYSLCATVRQQFCECGDCNCCPRHSELYVFLPWKTKQNKKTSGSDCNHYLRLPMAIRVTSFAYQLLLKYENMKKVQFLLHYARTTVYTAFKLVCIQTKYYIIGLLIKKKKKHIYTTAKFITLKFCVWLLVQLWDWTICQKYNIGSTTEDQVQEVEECCWWNRKKFHLCCPSVDNLSSDLISNSTPPPLFIYLSLWYISVS